MDGAVVITGAFGGMGRSTALTLAEMGFRVFALDRVTEELGEGITPIETDLTDEESVRAALDKIQAECEKIFAIIHFAGVYMLDSLVEMDTADAERIFRVNLGGVFLVNKLLLPLLERGSRIIITTSELAVLDPLPFTGIYAVTKAALDKYAYSLRMELQLLGIQVSVLRSGAVDTGMLGVSIRALESFVEKTELYTCNAARFKSIVERVEARSVPCEAIAKRVTRVLRKKNPRFAYAINRNPLLLLLNALPKCMQLWIIKQVLKG